MAEAVIESSILIGSARNDSLSLHQLRFEPHDLWFHTISYGFMTWHSHQPSTCMTFIMAVSAFFMAPFASSQKSWLLAGFNPETMGIT